MPVDFLWIIKRIWNWIGLVKVRRLLFCASKLIELDLLADGEDSVRTRNGFDQKALANRVLKQMTEVSSHLTRALNIHLNVEQDFTMNTSNLFMTLETLKTSSLLGKEIPSVGNARLHLPSTWNLSFDERQTGSLRVCFHLFQSSDGISVFSLSLVDIGTFSFVCFFVEYEPFSIDFLDLDGSTRKRTSSSY